MHKNRRISTNQTFFDVWLIGGNFPPNSLPPTKRWKHVKIVPRFTRRKNVSTRSKFFPLIPPNSALHLLNGGKLRNRPKYATYCGVTFTTCRKTARLDGDGHEVGCCWQSFSSLGAIVSSSDIVCHRTVGTVLLALFQWRPFLSCFSPSCHKKKLKS